MYIFASMGFIISEMMLHPAHDTLLKRNCFYHVAPPTGDINGVVLHVRIQLGLCLSYRPQTKARIL